MFPRFFFIRIETKTHDWLRYLMYLTLRKSKKRDIESLDDDSLRGFGGFG